MKTKEENSYKKDKKTNPNLMHFWKANWALVVLIMLAIIVIIYLSFVALAPYWNKKSLENDIINSNSNSPIAINKIVSFSNAYGINNSNNQAKWNLTLSQYTDIAIYLNVATDVSSMYIDNISFSNNNSSHLGLSSLSIEDFGKSPIIQEELTNTQTEENIKLEENTQTSESRTGTSSKSTRETITNIETPERINLEVVSPITLRYWNQNLKENCFILDVDTPLTFDGSILKRGKVTLSSIKNTISFTLHIQNSTNQDYTLPISIPINLENKETGKSIYDGNYLEEQLY